MKVVISQPMFLPWIGLFEQIKLADVYIHYDDVQLPQGRSFMSRVQVKGANGIFWLTAPIDRKSSGMLIREANYLPVGSWADDHLQKLRHSYRRASHFDEMVELAERIYAFPESSVSAFNQNALEEIASFLGLRTTFYRSSELDIAGSSSQRLIDICAYFGATEYVTGHGALRYLDHEGFEARGVEVQYMDYKKLEYPQLHGEFTPYVTVLDAIANCGRGASELIQSGSLYWRTVVGEGI